ALPSAPACSRALQYFPTRRSSDLFLLVSCGGGGSSSTAAPTPTSTPAPTPSTVTVSIVSSIGNGAYKPNPVMANAGDTVVFRNRSEEHTSELQSPCNFVCRLSL